MNNHCFFFAVLLLAANQISAAPATYCNPMPLPKIPLSRNCRDDAEKEQFRELADPSLLVEDGKIYVYPSDSMAWRSVDGGASWEKLDIGVEDIGYAPTIVKHGGKFLLMGNESIYASESPEGPFKFAAKVPPPEKPSPDISDPMLFSEDGRLYLYYGCSPTSGIWACELDSKTFSSYVQPPRQVIAFEPDRQFWERMSVTPDVSWMEGAWMVKINGRYCLTYSCGGTEFKRYATGAAWGNSPMGPFVKQRNNPFLRKTFGVVTGIGHGSIVHGLKRGELLAAYTVFNRSLHPFERLIGFDRVTLDANGELSVQSASDTPQYADGSGAAPWDTMPLKGEKIEFTDGELSTSAPVGAGYPSTVAFKADGLYMVRAFRLVWRELGMRGKKPGDDLSYSYALEGLDKSDGKWKTLYSSAPNAGDYYVDYRETPRFATDSLRIVVVSGPKNVVPAISEFTVFCE